MAPMPHGPFVGNARQMRQKCKDLRSIAIPPIKDEIKEQDREEAHQIVPLKPMHICEAANMANESNTSAVCPKHLSSSVKVQIHQLETSSPGRGTAKGITDGE
ncbi:hypothetical protein WISP_64907 [Willisornis vidua]|uniref:Uncharacterized protein n=1 Tax=Willisornis vidua TaxID=1566151 RepID=A0ABQ9DC69_9PASS|nr:hypothetical protein WISP_64907 [Willisornis vidua]